MKKSILFVIDSLSSGGAEKSLVSLLSILDYKKFEVDLLMFSIDGLYLPLVPEEVNILEELNYFKYNKDNDKRNLRIEISKIKNSLLLRTPIYKKKYHSAQIISKNIFKNLEKQRKKYDIAIAYSQGLPTYYVIDKVDANKKLSWINTDYKKAGYNTKFDVKYYEKYNYIVAVSEKNREVLEEVYPQFKDKIKVIYDIISPKLVIDMANKGKGYIDNFDGIRILTIGRHVHLKGYDMAIDAAKLLKESGVNFRWYSIGEGELTNQLKKQVKDSGLEKEFIFLGTFTNPYPFVKQCDIYCQPSRFEGFGMAIAEAKILNKPIVVTNFDIVYDQIDNEINGIIADMNPDDISRAIINFINNSEKKGSILKNMQRYNKQKKSSIDNFYNLILD